MQQTALLCNANYHRSKGGISCQTSVTQRSGQVVLRWPDIHCAWLGRGKDWEESPAAAAATATKSLQSCPTLCDPTDCSLPGFSVRRILQARTLEWVAISFSREESPRGVQIQEELVIGHIAGKIQTSLAVGPTSPHPCRSLLSREKNKWLHNLTLSREWKIKCKIPIPALPFHLWKIQVNVYESFSKLT